MPYHELVKNFNRIRDYMREFYVYGFKSRDEFTKKSARSYDNERRRVESWLGDYMQFRCTADGKNVFLSIDSRLTRHNPLYQAWKTKSFTDGDITLHFLLLDILSNPDESFTLAEIMDALDRALSEFASARTFDESTVRKKLKEYISEGLLTSERTGKALRYRRAAASALPDADLLHFFSEVAPCGVIGSFLLDRTEDAPETLGAQSTAPDTPMPAGRSCSPRTDHFAFKHHYITGALDSEILCALFLAMQEKRSITLTNTNRRKTHPTEHEVVPLKIMSSAQNGRQYLLAYSPHFRQVTAFRTDNILSVKAGKPEEGFDEYRQILDRMLPHMWGISTQSWSGARMEHVEFTVRYADSESHIPQRLEREKRCGTVEHLDRGTSRFSADVYDASEMIPWIRTFLCRIESLHISNPVLDRQFREDLQTMYAMYGLEGGEPDAL